MRTRIQCVAVAALLLMAVVITGCAEFQERTEERDSIVLLKCRFQGPGYSDYECLQATPETSPLTDLNGASRVTQEHGTDFEIVNCPDREEVDADYVCEDWVEAQGCKLEKMFYTSQPGEKIYLYGCDFNLA
jgi:hypothetical protein